MAEGSSLLDKIKGVTHPKITIYVCHLPLTLIPTQNEVNFLHPQIISGVSQSKHGYGTSLNNWRNEHSKI